MTGNRSWLLSDERQSVIGLTNGSGVTAAINTYDEYGVPGSGNAGRFQYTGQMWLPDAQVYHYRARAYAPQLGRFLQADPMGYAAGANLYGYVGGDPVNFTDPSGTCGLKAYIRRWVYANSSGENNPNGNWTKGETAFNEEVSVLLPCDSPDPWNFSFSFQMLTFNVSSPAPTTLSCSAGRGASSVATATNAGGYTSETLAKLAEYGGGGRAAASAFGPLGTGFMIANFGAQISASTQRGQTFDVAFVNAGAPALGSYLGGSAGGVAGAAGGGLVSGGNPVVTGLSAGAFALGGAYAGDNLGGRFANLNAIARGQYCP